MKDPLNVVADTLSRNEVREVNPTVVEEEFEAEVWERENLVKHQGVDHFCKKIIKELEKVNGSGYVEHNKFYLNSYKIICKDGMDREGENLICRNEIIVLPRSMVAFMLENNHEHILVGHMDYKKTLAKMKYKYFWSTMCQDIRNFIRSCDKCQRSQRAHVKAPVQNFKRARFPFEKVFGYGWAIGCY